MRDALTSLEQLSVFGAGDISLSAATDFLGEVSGSVLGSVCRARWPTGTWRRSLVPFPSSRTRGRDLLQFTRELAAHVRDVYVVSVVPSAEGRGRRHGRGARLPARGGRRVRLPRPPLPRAHRSGRRLERDAHGHQPAPGVGDSLHAHSPSGSDLTLESSRSGVADLERQIAILATPRALDAAAPVIEKNLEQMPASPVPPQPASSPQPEPPANEPAPEPVPEAVAAPSPAPAPERSDDLRGRGDAAVECSPEPSRDQPPARVARRATSAEQTGGARRGGGGGHTNGNLQRLWKRGRRPARGPGAGEGVAPALVHGGLR